VLALRLARGGRLAVQLRRLLVVVASAGTGFLLLCSLGHALAHPEAPGAAALRLAWCAVPLAATVQLAVAVARTDPGARPRPGLAAIGLGPARLMAASAATTALSCALGSAFALLVFLRLRGDLGGLPLHTMAADPLAAGRPLPMPGTLTLLALIPGIAWVCTAWSLRGRATGGRRVKPRNRAGFRFPMAVAMGGPGNGSGRGAGGRPGKEPGRMPGRKPGKGPGKGGSDPMGMRVTSAPGTRVTVAVRTGEPDGSRTRDSDGRRTRDSDRRRTQDSDGRRTGETDGPGTEDSGGRGTGDSGAEGTEILSASATGGTATVVTSEASADVSRDGGDTASVRTASVRTGIARTAAAHADITAEAEAEAGAPAPVLTVPSDLPWGFAVLAAGLAVEAYAGPAGAAELSRVTEGNAPGGMLAGWVLAALGLALVGPGLTHLCGRLLQLFRPGALRLLAGRVLMAEAACVGRPLGVVCAVAALSWRLLLHGNLSGGLGWGTAGSPGGAGGGGPSFGPLGTLGILLVIGCTVVTLTLASLETRQARADITGSLLRLGAPATALRTAVALRAGVLFAVFGLLTVAVAELAALPSVG
jgi:hypothetical protein